MRIEYNIDRAGIFVLEQNFLPGLAAVGGAEDAALRVRPPCVSQSCDENDVGVAWVDDDRSDVARVFQPNVCPRPAGIGRFVHAVPVGNIAAKAGFATTCIE